MILVCGIVADAMVELMCARLDDLGYEYMLFDQLHYPGRYHLSWEIGKNGLRGYLASPERKVDIAELTGVYARYVNYRGGPERSEFSQHERQMIDAEYQLSLMQLLDLLPCTVVNRVKGIDIERIRRSTSRSLPSWSGCGRPEPWLRPTPIKSGRFTGCADSGSFTNRSAAYARSYPVSATPIWRSALRACATARPSFRKWWKDTTSGCTPWAGRCLRRRSFPTSAITATQGETAAHCRRARSTFRPISPRPACAVGSLGLVLSGIDLRRTPDGEYYCFEINPSPGFIFYERMTGQPISEAVAHLLHRRQ